MTGFEAYKMYISLKLHFTSETYDYVKFNGKSRTTVKSFEKRSDKYFFEKLGKKFSSEALLEYFIANFILDKYSWIGEIVSVNGDRNHTEWKKRIESLHYTFKCDVDFLLSEVDSFDDLFRVDITHPPLLKYYLGSKITLETFVILNKLLNFIPQFDKSINEPLVWKDVRKTLIKYSSFLDIDLCKYKHTLKEKVLEQKCLSSHQT